MSGLRRPRPSTPRSFRSSEHEHGGGVDAGHVGRDAGVAVQQCAARQAGEISGGLVVVAVVIMAVVSEARQGKLAHFFFLRCFLVVISSEAHPNRKKRGCVPKKMEPIILFYFF